MFEFGAEHRARRRQGDTSYAGRRAGIKRDEEERSADSLRAGGGMGIAAILARGVLRLKTSRLPQNSSDSTTDPLEVSGDSRLSVTTG